MPTCVDMKSIFFKYCCCCKTKEYTKFLEQTKYCKGEIVSNLDLVKSMQRMRMHGLALRLLMNHDVEKVSGWFGYKRDISYAGGEMAGDVDENK